jgi:hypothetical protein
MIPKATKALFFGLMALCFTGLLGCKSSKGPGSSSHAAVTITGRSEEDIARVTKEVFSENGFSFKLVRKDTLVFERPGSFGDTLAWGGIDGKGVVVRAKVQMQGLPDGSRLLECNVFAVRDAGDRIFETESRDGMSSKSPYRKMLEEVQKRLEGAAATNTAH